MATRRNPKDSMVSTWRKDKTNWTYHHHVINFLDPGFYHDANNPVPVHAKTDPVPNLTEWSCHLYILAHALWPMVIQHAYYTYFGENMHPLLVFVLYQVAWKGNSLHQVTVLRRLAQRFGYLDGDKALRDEIPDVGVDKVLSSAQWTTTFRPIFTIFLSYNSKAPVSLSWWLPVELALYSIVLDFWFYVYHRSCHELDALWKYHRTHHLTKHPNPFLSSYADGEQELLEIAIIPMLTYGVLKLMGFPMGFYDWWICHEYLIFSETMGHSGLRLYAGVPSTANWLLKLLDCDLRVEDHDLHHRNGWRASHNYGKQTRLWDRIFGTCGERIESRHENVDYEHSVNFPLI